MTETIYADPEIDMDELERAIGTLCAAAEGYGDRVEHMSEIIRMCHDRKLPANAIRPQAEMDIIRYGIDAATTRRRLTKSLDQDSKKNHTDVRQDVDVEAMADKLLRVFIDYADSLSD